MNMKQKEGICMREWRPLSCDCREGERRACNASINETKFVDCHKLNFMRCANRIS